MLRDTPLFPKKLKEGRSSRCFSKDYGILPGYVPVAHRRSASCRPQTEPRGHSACPSQNKPPTRSSRPRPLPGSFPGHIPDHCRDRNRNRNSELGQLGVPITTTTTAALIATTRSRTRTGTYARAILNQAYAFALQRL